MTRPYKICFVIDGIASPTAGTEKQLLLLIENLDRLRFDPSLCVLRASGWLRQNFHGCELLDIGITSFKNPWCFVKVIKFASFLKKERIDIVQTHFIDGNKVGVLAAKLAGVKKIISTRRNQGFWHNRCELYQLKILNKWVTCFLANSENTKHWAIKAEGIDASRIEVIHNGLVVDRYVKGTQGQRSRFRTALGFPTDAIIVGIVANLRQVKAVDVFIRSAKLVLATYPHIRFVVVGNGPEREHLERYCSSQGLTPFVRFMGERLDIAGILGCIDIGVLSSISESFSNSIVEYLAAGLPVVCTDVGGAREAVEDGVNGFVVNPGNHAAMADRIINIVQSGTVAQFGHNSRNKAENLFSLPAILQQYEKFYERLVQQ